jgi:hypothetical protein
MSLMNGAHPTGGLEKLTLLRPEQQKIFIQFINDINNIAFQVLIHFEATYKSFIHFYCARL